VVTWGATLQGGWWNAGSACNRKYLHRFSHFSSGNQRMPWSTTR